ncbi:hypothetical protein EHS25_008450 [Saitozyma podzolica]|uniref:Uncharacterized protein n=1 Tax=Saitozyma podzolica TaxID=1890683 RepID=A0A427YPG8_9TREE|nr:hypothetical protein EHS25_008450 [Saitozyma podzolica]
MSDSLTSFSSSLSTEDLQALGRAQHLGQDMLSAKLRDTSSSFGCTVRDTLMDDLSLGHLSQLDNKDGTLHTRDDMPGTATMLCGRSGYNEPVKSVSVQSHAPDAASWTASRTGFAAKL